MVVLKPILISLISLTLNNGSARGTARNVSETPHFLLQHLAWFVTTMGKSTLSVGYSCHAQYREKLLGIRGSVAALGEQTFHHTSFPSPLTS